MSSEVRLSHLRKVFKDPRSKKEMVAVEDFSLTIKRGELVTLLGPSGCGKTTALRMLAGFETPTSGQIWIGHNDLTRVPPNQRNCAMVFQSYALFPHLTVLENISYGLKFRKHSDQEKQKKIDRMIEIVGLGGLEERRPSELSGGQQQRVALARALVVEPEILLFDEPLSNLDAKLREAMRFEIRQIQQRLGITAVYVTHDQIEALAISDRIVVMNKGRIEQVGSPQDIYRLPESKFVADFVGFSNFMSAQLIGGSSDEEVNVKTADFELKMPRYRAPTHEAALTFACRPEAIQVDATATSTAEVLQSVFLGDRYEVLLSLPSQTKILGRIKVRELQSLKVGDQIRFKIRSEDSALLTH